MCVGYIGKGAIGLAIPGCPETFEEPEDNLDSGEEAQGRSSHKIGTISMKETYS